MQILDTCYIGNKYLICFQYFKIFPWNDKRLPEHIEPLAYDMELTPNLETGHVEGGFRIE